VSVRTAFLASDEARWITGVTLPVDGGATAVTPLIMAPQLRAVTAPGDV
jgi:NAD(P)-dependent dehydrogenase (short-subunit alcohol dehydrogenase family)